MTLSIVVFHNEKPAAQTAQHVPAWRDLVFCHTTANAKKTKKAVLTLPKLKKTYIIIQYIIILLKDNLMYL